MVSQETSLLDIPVVPGLPLIGSALDFKRDKLAFMRDLVETYGDICAFRVGREEVVVLNNPEHVNAVLLDAGIKFINHRPTKKSALAPLLGQGIVYREGSSHRQHRRKLTPLFTPRVVSNYATIMTSVADETQRGWTDG